MKGIIINLYKQINSTDNSLRKLLYYKYIGDINFENNLIKELLQELDRLSKAALQFHNILDNFLENNTHDILTMQKRWEIRQKESNTLQNICILRRDILRIIKFPDFDQNNEFWVMIDEEEFKNLFDEKKEDVLYYEDFCETR